MRRPRPATPRVASDTDLSWLPLAFQDDHNSCDDKALKAVLVHNMNDEMEHAAMLLEWLRRNNKEFAEQLEKFSKATGTTGPIVKNAK